MGGRDGSHEKNGVRDGRREREDIIERRTVRGKRERGCRSIYVP